MSLPPPTSNRAVFKLLWKAARRRAAGRQKRQRQIMRQKKGSDHNPLQSLSSILMIFVMVMVHAALGWMLMGSREAARIADCELHGKLVIEDYGDSYLEDLARFENPAGRSSDKPHHRSTDSVEEALKKLADRTAYWRSRELGGSKESQEQRIKKHFHEHGSQGFILERDALRSSAPSPGYWPVATFVLLWWLVMIVFQGEGLELDIQRRRHPMWEWVQSHPVRPVAAFAADLLAPMMANPVYFTAPVFWGIVLGSRFGLISGIVGGVLVGIPFAVAASCLNKALEISALLRLSPRTRGAALGLMSWLGYAAMMLPLFSMNAAALKNFIVRSLIPLGPWFPAWPVRSLTSGWGSTPVLWQAVLSGIAAGVALLVIAVAISWWGAQQGLQAAGGATRPRKSKSGGSVLLAGNPLYRKELLWFWRDKGAVVQAILIPLTIAGFQLFNLRGLLDNAIGSWNGVCGAAIICGTYFLLVLGPRSLASEGGALWIATTWPRGMEDLLKAKARLWWFVSSVIVGFILLVAICLFPADWWRILLVAVGWGFFGRSLAEKTVTLATAPSSSGEAEPAPRSRQWAAMLGTLAFSSGVISGNWSIAIMGVVFSSLTAAAMWQNFRARLPFLFDPWSEKLPPAPSLMHAMIGITAMVEIIGITTAVVVAFGGVEYLGLARALAYGLVGGIAWLIMQSFLSGRDAPPASIWRWRKDLTFTEAGDAYGKAAVIGTVLGGLGLLYLMGLRVLPLTHDFMVEMDRQASGSREQHLWIFILAVGMAPFAEEYFFRGLLYRALDREWGGWHAMIGSAAYFAIYHPPVSWLPVFAVGVGSAWLFKKSGLLGPCVLLHLVYNAVIVGIG